MSDNAPLQDTAFSTNTSFLTNTPYRVAVIPARGGSQRIPRKNIRLLDGKPLIAYSIETAIESGLFDRIIVSTDDEEIADVARQFRAETPFMRPANLADHMTGTTPVMQHALSYLIEEGRTPDQACLIYATCPMLTPDDLQQGFAQLNQRTAFCFSATTFAFRFNERFTSRKTANWRLCFLSTLASARKIWWKPYTMRVSFIGQVPKTGLMK